MSGPSRVGAVSAVVCNYQGEAYLVRCLDAIAALEGDALDEVIVIDNASTDGGEALVRDKYPHVRWIQMGYNSGPAAARNRGMREAKNRWVLAVDNDAALEPDGLRKLMAAAETRPDAIILQPRSVFAAQPDHVHYDGGSLHYAGLIVLRNWYRPLSEAVAADNAIDPDAHVRDVDCAVSVCLLMDAEHVLEIGGYDEAYFILFEDLDLSYRLRSAGQAILSVEDAIVHHDAGTAGISFREGNHYPGPRVLYHSRNRWRFLLKNHGAWTLFVSTPGLLLYELAWFAFAVRHGGLWPWLRGKGQFLRALPDTLRLRRQVQGRRAFGDGKLLVGGPLTLTPAVSQSDTSQGLAGALNWGLTLWWRLARRVLS
jgi:GT2 family glycosyltransferase